MLYTLFRLSGNALCLLVAGPALMTFSQWTQRCYCRELWNETADCTLMSLPHISSTHLSIFHLFQVINWFAFNCGRLHLSQTNNTTGLLGCQVAPIHSKSQAQRQGRRLKHKTQKSMSIYITISLLITQNSKIIMRIMMLVMISIIINNSRVIIIIII